MWSVLLSATVLVGSACADDATVTTTSDSMGTTTGTDSTPTVTITTFDTGDSTSEVADTTAGETTVSVDSTATVGDTTIGDTTTGDDTTTGGEELPGVSISQLVSAGERASSASYTLVYTFGQPSALQSTHVSTNYQIQGGLIGANGSPP